MSLAYQHEVDIILFFFVLNELDVRLIKPVQATLIQESILPSLPGTMSLSLASGFIETYSVNFG
jgi:hypothetical protein